MNAVFLVIVFSLCLWLALCALALLTLKIIGNVLDMLYPPRDGDERPD